jgi:hypothetical protein
MIDREEEHTAIPSRHERTFVADVFQGVLMCGPVMRNLSNFPGRDIRVAQRSKLLDASGKSFRPEFVAIPVFRPWC